MVIKTVVDTTVRLPIVTLTPTLNSNKHTYIYQGCHEHQSCPFQLGNTNTKNIDAEEGIQNQITGKDDGN